MLLDEWGGGYRVVQGQNEEVEASTTFQQLEDAEISQSFQPQEVGPKHRDGKDERELVKFSSTFQQLKVNPEQVKIVKDFPSLGDYDLSKSKTFEKDAEQADVSRTEMKSSLEVNSQEEKRSGKMPLIIKADLAKDDQLSREKHATKKREKKRKVLKKLKQVGMKKVRNSGLAKEKAKLRYENRDLKRKNKEMKKEIEKLKKRERPNNGKESKRIRIKKGSVKNSDVCMEKWATFSSAALGPAASVIKQVIKLLKF